MPMRIARDILRSDVATRQKQLEVAKGLGKRNGIRIDDRLLHVHHTGTERLQMR
jgi:hypothetical protein